MQTKPAYIKGFMWLAFSATAMLSAFILPIHIWALANGYTMKLPSLIGKSYFTLLVIAALYHGLYRTQTILFDLGITRPLKIIGMVLTVLFIAASAGAFYLFFLLL